MEQDRTPELSTRKEKILQAVVIEYVTGAEPIGSDYLTHKYELGGKSATIRAELADITDLGFLEQPHTSAGRIPSDLGYRYFVDHLMTPQAATAQEVQSVKSVQSEEETLRELLTETTKVLSRLTSLFAAAATMKDHSVAMKHVVVTALGPDKALLILVLGNGHVENRILEIPHGTTLEHIGKVNEILIASLPGRTLGSMVKLRLPGIGQSGVDHLLTEVCGVIRSSAKDLTRGHFISDGEEYILAQPEFRGNKDMMDALVRSLENEESLRTAIVGLSPLEDGITIGKENDQPNLQSLAISRRVFYVGSQEAGAIAIIGPTRQDYGRGLTLLDYTAQAISETLTKIYS